MRLFPVTLFPTKLFPTTLFRQIAVLISLLFLLLLGALAWNDFRQTSRFLQGQLQTTAQDMATLMGVSVTGAIRTGDTAAIDTIFNAVFDSGYYTQIILTSPSGQMISSRRQAVVINQVPAWFVERVPLAPASGHTQVMAGWMPYGNLSVTLHPGYAYAQLYQNLKTMLFWFALAAGLGLTALWWLLHLLLRPLETVSNQAEAVGENRFVVQEPLPRTRELRQVAEAMNRMVAKVKTIFNEQAETLGRYHAVLYRDPLTGLGSRRYLMMTLGEACADEATSSGGWLVLLKLEGFADIRQNLGYHRANEVLITLGELLTGMTNQEGVNHEGVNREGAYQQGAHPQRANQDGADRAARLNACEFAVLLHTDATAAEAIVQRLFAGFRDHPSLGAIRERAWLCAGLAAFGPGQATSAILADADFALMQALSAGAYALRRSAKALPDLPGADLYHTGLDKTGPHDTGLHDTGLQITHLPTGKLQWRTWLEDSLEQGRLFLVGQEVRNPDHSVYHRELFVRLRDAEGHVIPAAAFMPVAASQGLEFAIDRAVFRMALALKGEAAAEPIALNLSNAFLVDATALVELERFLEAYKLKRDKAGAPPLAIEISHFALLQHTDTAAHIADRLRAAGYRFGVDRLDLGASLAPLQDVRPHYIKVGAARLSAMADNQLSTAFQALRTLAGSLDIHLIAVGVDSGETHARLSALGIDTQQGYFLGQPTELE